MEQCACDPAGLNWGRDSRVVVVWGRGGMQLGWYAVGVLWGRGGMQLGWYGVEVVLDGTEWEMGSDWV